MSYFYFQKKINLKLKELVPYVSLFKVTTFVVLFFISQLVVKMSNNALVMTIYPFNIPKFYAFIHYINIT